MELFTLWQSGRPPDETGNANAAFENIVFHTAKGAVVASLIVFSFAKVNRAVVAGVEDDGVFIQIVLFECVENAVDACVHSANHAIGLADGSGVFVQVGEGLNVFFWCFERAVRGVVGYVKEKGFGFMAFDKVYGVIGEDVGEVATICPFWLAVVFDDPVPVVHAAVHEASEFVEAPVVGVIAHVVQAIMPFAGHAGFVSTLFKEVGDGGFAQGNAIQAAVGFDGEGADSVVVSAGEEGGAGRGADGRARIVLHQAHAFVTDAIYVGRLQIGIAKDAEIAVALIVGEKDDDVWLLTCHCNIHPKGRSSGFDFCSPPERRGWGRCL